MLNPIATAGSAEVRALVHAADPVEPLLDTLDEHLIGGSADASVDPSPQTAPGVQLALLAARTPAGLTLAAAQRPSDRFEGVQVAGSMVLPDQLIKEGASKNLAVQQKRLYGGLEKWSAALSAGVQDPARLADLRNVGLREIDAYRRAVQADPALQQELLSRGLTSPKDLESVSQLSLLGDPATVHRLAAATAQAGGAGQASGAAIAAKLRDLEPLGDAFVARIPGDARVEAVAPGAYLNTLLGMRRHVDSTMLYLASLTDAQMAQLGAYTDAVMAGGGLTRYKDSEGLAAAWAGAQITQKSMDRLTEGLSIAGMGLRNFSRSIASSFPQLSAVAPSSALHKQRGALMISGDRIGPLYENQLPGRLAEELAAARIRGISPTSPVGPKFDAAINQGTIKYAVDELGQIKVIPKFAADGAEISHAVITKGRPVLAAGEAEIAGSVNDGYFGVGINEHSGHFMRGNTAAQNAEVIKRAKHAFAAFGIEF